MQFLLLQFKVGSVQRADYAFLREITKFLINGYDKILVPAVFDNYIIVIKPYSPKRAVNQLYKIVLAVNLITNTFTKFCVIKIISADQLPVRIKYIARTKAAKQNDY